jgi:hypothetical protein
LEFDDYKWESEFAIRHQAIGRAQGRAEGEAKGEARAVLMILRTRGISISGNVHKRITACTDQDQLEAWVERAVKVEAVEQLFD